MIYVTTLLVAVLPALAVYDVERGKRKMAALSVGAWVLNVISLVFQMGGAA